jgi:hypothetical protein
MWFVNSVEEINLLARSIGRAHGRLGWLSVEHLHKPTHAQLFQTLNLHGIRYTEAKMLQCP